MAEATNGRIDKRRVKIKPAFLEELIPQHWAIAAEQLALMAERHKVPEERMRLFIRVAAQMSGEVPLVPAVAMFCEGRATLEEKADGSVEVTVIDQPPGYGSSPSGLILPN